MTGRTIERKVIIPKSVLKEENYPPEVDEYDFFKMQEEWEHDFKIKHIFAYIRYEKGGPYVDVYFWEKYIPGEYERFVIMSGNAMEEEKESRFMEIVHSYVRWDIYEGRAFIREAKQLFPQMNISWSELLPVVLEHMYFSAFRGPREILYKAALYNWAYYLDRIDDYNVLGTTPSEILGLPLRLLRILNIDEMVQYYDDIPKMKAVYNRFKDYIHDGIGAFQWIYLIDVFEGKKVFNKTIYKRLKDCVKEFEYNDYFMYMRMIKSFGIKLKKIPTIEDVYIFTRYGDFDDYKRGNDIDRKIKERYELESNFWKAQCSEYIVEMPKNLGSILRESIAMRSCVASYVKSHANGNTTILFLRHKDRRYKSFVTIEVRDGGVTQIFESCNRVPSLDVLLTVEEFARRKGLIYDAELLYGLYADKRMSGDVYEYLSDLRLAFKYVLDDGECTQMTIWDFLPRRWRRVDE